MIELRWIQDNKPMNYDLKVGYIFPLKYQTVHLNWMPFTVHACAQVLGKVQWFSASGEWT